MATKWWEVDTATPAPQSRLRRPLSDEEFFAEQQAVEDELFRADRADDSQTQRALNQSMAQLRAAPKAVRGLARSLVGGDGTEDLQAAKAIIDREAEFAPDVQQLEDVDDAGSALAYGRNAVLSNLPTALPTIASAIFTGGLSAAAGAGLRGVAKKGLARAVGGALTARTGSTAGAVAASSALQSNQVIDAALDDSTGEDLQTRAAKATVGAITTGALDALPQISLLNRMGLGGAAKRAIAPEIQRSLAARLAREGGKQALQEGGTEAIQSLGENLTHKWINDNVEVLGPKAFSEYLNSAVAGALVGGVLGAPAGIRGGPSPVRDRAKSEWNWLKTKASEAMPAEAFDAAGKVKDTVSSAADTAKAGAAKASDTVQDVFNQAKQTLDPSQPNPPKIISALFGKNHDDLRNDVDEDSLLDELESSFSQIDQGGRAPSDANGIIGRTQEDGIVRGGVPFSGFSLFNADQAQALWELNRGKMTVGDAFVLTSLPPDQIGAVGDKAIKAAGKYLLTGDRAQVDEDALTDYLKVLEPDQRMQFIYAASRTAENIAKAREASGVEELTPRSLRKGMDSQTEALKSSVDIDDKENFDLRAELSDNPDGDGNFADFQESQAMAEERPIPVALSEVVSAKDFSRLSFGDRLPSKADGTVKALNSKGNARTVSLAGLVARGWQAAKEGVFSTPNGVVDVVVQALDTAAARGMTIDPNEIQPGLWLGGETKLTPRQAEQIRNGMRGVNDSQTITRTKDGKTVTIPPRAPVQETTGLPSVPAGERPYDNFTNESADDQIQGEDGVENLDGVDVSLRARTRSPLGTRVSDEGKLAEAETVDTESADDIGADQRRAETDATDALHRANKVLGLDPLKGRDLDQLMENFGKRVNSAAMKARLNEKDAKGNPTPEAAKLQQAVDGARRAIQRIERDTYNDPDVDDKKKSTHEQVMDALKSRLGKERTEAAEQARANKETTKRLNEEVRAAMKKYRPRNDIDFEPDDLIEAANTPGNLDKEQDLLDRLTDKLGLERITLIAMPAGKTPYGQYSNKNRLIALGNQRQGNARLDTLLHELGHAIVFDTFEKLPLEQQQEITREYQAWVREAASQKKWLQARKSRAPFFIKKWLDENRSEGKSKDIGDLTQVELDELLSFDEFLADNLARALGQNQETRGAIGQFFADLAAKLTELYEMFAGSKYEPAPSVEAWVRQLLQADQARALHAQPVEVQQTMFDQDPELPISPPPATPPNATGGRPSNLFGALSQRDRGILEKALRNRGVQEQIYQAADEATRKKLDLYGQDMSVLINLGAALHAQGRLNLDAGKGVFQKLINMIRTALGLPSNKAVAEQIMADHAANQIVAGRYDGEAKAFNKNEYTKAVLATERAILRVAQPVVDKLTTDMGTRMRESNIPAMRKLATLIETRNAENAGEESFTAMRQRFMSLHATAYMESVAGLNEDQKKVLVRALQRNERPEGALGEAFDKNKQLMEKFLLWGNANGVLIKKRQDYFPVVMDRKKVEEHWDELKALLSKPEHEQDVRGFFKDNKTPIDTLVDRMVQIAQTSDISHVGEVDFSLGVYSPAVSAQRQQIMGFITNKVADRKTLAKFQSDSLDAIMLGYVNQLSKKAAKVKVFGEAKIVTRADGTRHEIKDRLGQLMAAARSQGASTEQLKMASDFINMAMGSYHAELNPAIRWVFRQVDKVWGSELGDMPIEQWAHYQQLAQTYQNVRLLGLAALSSLIDPLGSLVRGGSVTGTVHSMWDAVKAMRSDTDGLRQMAEYLGVVEKYALSDAIAATYGGSFDPQGKLGKINNALFKYNGLEAVTRHSRLTALAMGHRFLLKHAQTPNEHSERMLKELGLTAADVVPGADPKYVALTPKVEAALRRFVNESVVRPNPSQRPGWHNDPNFLFAAQYKGYLYAFNTTIVDRMLKEAEAGNYKQAILPMIPYLGVTVAAEMVRYAIQHPGEDDPRDELAYMKLAMVRSGMVGPRFGVLNDARTDTRYGSWMTNSWIGPTGQQAADLLDVATGERSIGKTAIEALPGSAIFEDWDSGVSSEQTPAK